MDSGTTGGPSHEEDTLVPEATRGAAGRMWRQSTGVQTVDVGIGLELISRGTSRRCQTNGEGRVPRQGTILRRSENGSAGSVQMIPEKD